MYIIEVIPLTFIPRHQPQVLSYFYGESLVFGAVVEVNLNRRKVKGIVIASDAIKKRKLDFKKNVDFELKGVIKVLNSSPQVGSWQFKIAAFISNYYYAPLGVSLKTVLPPFWGKRSYSLATLNLKPESQKPNSIPQILKSDYIFTNLDNHHLDYQEEIEKQIRNGRQVFLMTAENTAAEYFLEKYTPLDPKFVSSGLSQKEYRELWEKVKIGKVKLIIGTRVGLFLPFNNLRLIIADDEANEAYKSDMTPRYHAVDLAQEVARIHNAKVISSAVVPRLETRLDSTLKPRDHKLEAVAANMIDEIKTGNFSILSRELKESLADSYAGSKNIIMYIPRRGHSNFIYCQTCHGSITCPNCSVSLVLHQGPETGLWCHHCSYRQPRPKQCAYCKSYALKAHGLGIEKVESELKKFYKLQNLNPPRVLRLDSDSVKTESEETKIIKTFLENPGSILIATQMIFSHKYLLKSEIIGIINADTLVNIPDFGAEERLFRDMLTLGLMGSKVLIQTHNPEQTAIKFAASGSLGDFLKSELADREEFRYPPYSNLIKLSYRHKDPLKAKKEAAVLAEKLRSFIKNMFSQEEFELAGPSSAFIHRERGLYVWNIIIKVKSLNSMAAAAEKIKTRNEILRVVPAGWVIDVDPKNII